VVRDDAVAEIQEGLKFRSDHFDRIVNRLKRVQFLLEQGRTLPWFLVEENYVSNVGVGEDIAIPPGFIREVVTPEHGGLYLLSADSGQPRYLQKMDADEARTAFTTLTGDTSLCPPRAYVIRKDVFQVFPALTVATTFYMDYYKSDDVLSTNIENEWLAHAPYLLIGEAGASFARTLGLQSALAEFQELAQLSWEAVVKENILRETANRAYVVGRNT
jgi:hypothetical protein